MTMQSFGAVVHERGSTADALCGAGTASHSRIALTHRIELQAQMYFYRLYHPTRKAAAKLNPQVQCRAAAEDQLVYIQHSQHAQPAHRTDQTLRADAISGNRDFGNGLPHTSARHSCQLTGVLASHVFMKLSYWGDAACHDPDCMHTGTGEMKGICDMVTGGTGGVPICDTSRLPHVAAYEVYVNKRFTQLKYLASELQPLLAHYVL